MSPLLGHIRAAVAGYPREFWPKIVAVGAQCRFSFPAAICPYVLFPPSLIHCLLR
jgi:hypothetical protein